MEPLVISYGLGVDSTANLVGLKASGIRPDLILFAEVGGEKQETYDYLPIINSWLLRVGFPTVTVVRYQPKNYKHWPPYRSLEENCLTNGTLPSISFGGRKKGACSLKWKKGPQDKFLEAWGPALETWRAGGRVTKVIGYDCSSRDRQRLTYAEKRNAKNDDPRFRYWYPLQDWGWDRQRCMEEIAAAGLPVPMKSSCFFCFAMQPEEVAALPVDKLRRIILLESRALPRLKKITGLWGRDSKRRPGSMTKFILERGLLPAAEVAAIQNVPDVLIRFQGSYAAKQTSSTLAQFLGDNFPTLYSGKDNVKLSPLPENPQLQLFGMAAD